MANIIEITKTQNILEITKTQNILEINTAGIQGPKGDEGGVNLSDSVAYDLGIASAGISENASRSDHVHNLPSKAQIGLGNVDNTSDINKPISSAVQTALNGKASSGSNSDITSLTGLTTPLSVAQGGTGGATVSAALLNLGLGTYPVRNYSPVSSGDNSTAINAAITAAYNAGGGVVELPPGTLEASNITLKSNVTLAPASRGSTILNTGTSTYLIQAEGSLGSNVLLTADAAQGDTTLIIASTTGISAGDYIIVSDGYSYAATDSTYKSGEMVQVSSVDSSTQLTLYSALSGSMYSTGAYTTANTGKINRVSPIIMPCIEDIQILGSGSEPTVAIHAMYALRGSFSPIVRSFGNTGIMIRSCIDSAARDGIYEDLLDDIANGHAGYGVCVCGSSMGTSVQNNSMARCRHGFTMTGGATGFPHHTLVMGNIVRDTSQAGLDTHAACDGLLMFGNRVFRSAGAGISCRARNIKIENNDLYEVNNHGILIAEGGLSNVSVTNNHLDGINGHGISCYPSCSNLEISKNSIKNVTYDGITVFGSSTVASTNLRIRFNDIMGYGIGASSRTGILTTGTVTSTGGAITNNLINPLSGSAAYGIRTLYLTDSYVGYNVTMGTITTAAYSVGTNTSTGNEEI